MEFTRGTLLGRSLAADADGPVLIYTATVKTEVTLITMTYQAGGGSGGTFVVYHVLGGSAPGPIDIIGLGQLQSNTAERVGFQSPAIGSGIHMEAGDELYVEIDGADGSVHAYGVLATLPQIR